MANDNWYAVADESSIMTPGLLVYPERIDQNIQSMIQIAKDVKRLFPHVKTYKMQAIVKKQMAQGIQQFKCATLGELEMLIQCGAAHILLAIQPTQEKTLRFLTAQQAHPQIVFSSLIDNYDSLQLFSDLAKMAKQTMNLWIDINNGMNRTGIVPQKAADLYMAVEKDPYLNALGLHIYDGHIRSHPLDERIAKCNSDFEAVETLVTEIQERGGTVPNQITGGSPSFYPHALRTNNKLSPGTTLLWDLGYQKIWKESPFVHAAVLATRLISKPNKDIYCFDLGHKALASEMPLPRVQILGLENAVHKGQSEEHLIIEYTEPNNFKVGDLFYALPYHICPTVAKYNKAYTVIRGTLGPFWEIEARDYQQGA